MARKSVRGFDHYLVPPTAGRRSLTGLKVESVFDRRAYRKGMNDNNVEMKCFDVYGDAFHPEWSYTI